MGRDNGKGGLRVGVIGTGHVGLVTSVAMAAMGHRVTGTDLDAERIDQLQRGMPPFAEPMLPELLDEGRASGRLSFSLDAASAIQDADVVFICVGTPPRASGKANLIAVERSAIEVARHATNPVVVAEKSTVPTGTAQRLRALLRSQRPDLRIEVVSNPEFLREGRAVADAMQPDRILVGAETEWAFERMRRLYEPFAAGGRSIIETDIATAELAKYASNAFLAMKVSFINAVARVCERSGADVLSVAQIMGSDPRIGPAFLRAGMGYGGSCFPKDLLAFEQFANGLGYEFPLLREIARLNDEALEAAYQKVEDALWVLEDKRVALLGLAFKPGTDDVRFSPALALARRLLREGVRVVGFDPLAATAVKAELPEIELATDPYEAAAEAHCLVLCTESEDFAALDLDRLRDLLAQPVIVDGRNLLDPARAEAAGLSYYGVGRPAGVLVPRGDDDEERS